MEPLALYIHWPFCLAKCPYCDFNSHVRERIPQDRFRAALRAELAWEAARLGPRRLTSVFFGGGTPSLMEPGTVAALLEDAHLLFTPAGDIEITLEANPTSVELEKLAGFRAAGINRISLGVQSLDPEALRKSRPAAFGRPGHRRAGDCAADLPAHLLRPDLRPPRPDPAGLAGRAAPGAGPRRRPSLAVPAHHRARHRL